MYTSTLSIYVNDKDPGRKFFAHAHLAQPTRQAIVLLAAQPALRQSQQHTCLSQRSKSFAFEASLFKFQIAHRCLILLRWALRGFSAVFASRALCSFCLDAKRTKKIKSQICFRPHAHAPPRIWLGPAPVMTRPIDLLRHLQQTFHAAFSR